MRPRRTSTEHQAAAARRVSELSAELAATRAGSVPQTGVQAPAWADPVPAEAPVVPLPGRHAAPGRAQRLGAALLPQTLRGRVGLGAGPLTVVALLVAVGAGLTAVLVVRDDPADPVVTLPGPATGEELVQLPAASPPSGGPDPSAPVAAAASSTVTVDVAGKVRRPGIAVLGAGSRVVDAVEAAGGARRGVDLSTLNLARMLVDGEQILVGVDSGASAPVGAGEAPVVPTVPGVTGPLVNLNVASVAELETLPEVGPVTAAAIIEWRESHGGFTAVEELLEVDGIGEATLSQIVPHVTV